MPLRELFRYRDRWHSSLGDRAADISSDPRLGPVLSMLEQRDVDLESHLNGRPRTPGCRVRRSAGASLASGGAGSAVAWDTEDYDTDEFHSLSTNTSRLTIPRGLAGTYLVGYATNIAAGGGVVSTWISVNGATATRFGSQVDDNSAANGKGQTGTDFLYLNVGDYVECFMVQTSGGSLTVCNSPTIHSFWLTRTGD